MSNDRAREQSCADEDCQLKLEAYFCFMDALGVVREPINERNEIVWRNARADAAESALRASEERNSQLQELLEDSCCQQNRGRHCDGACTCPVCAPDMWIDNAKTSETEVGQLQERVRVMTTIVTRLLSIHTTSDRMDDAQAVSLAEFRELDGLDVLSRRSQRRRYE